MTTKNGPRRSYEVLDDIELPADVDAYVSRATEQAEADVQRRHGQRTQAGMKEARQRGATIGRPRKGPSVAQVMEAMERHPSFQAAARALKSTKTTVRRRYQEGLAAAAAAKDK